MFAHYTAYYLESSRRFILIVKFFFSPPLFFHIFNRTKFTAVSFLGVWKFLFYLISCFKEYSEEFGQFFECAWKNKFKLLAINKHRNDSFFFCLDITVNNYKVGYNEQKRLCEVHNMVIILWRIEGIASFINKLWHNLWTYLPC